MESYMVTTIDNPYDPFDNFEEWLSYDLEKGYNTCGLLAKYVHTSTSLSEAEEEEEIKRGFDEFLNINPFGIHKLVVKNRQMVEG